MRLPVESVSCTHEVRSLAIFFPPRSHKEQQVLESRRCAVPLLRYAFWWVRLSVS